MKEEWKSVKGYEGIYEISSFGNVVSLDRFVQGKHGLRRCRGREISVQYTIKGYAVFRVCKDGIENTVLVSRLVASHFIENPKNLEEVNHIDLNKKNNLVSNLEWCSHRENMDHAILHRRFGFKENLTLNWTKVFEIRYLSSQGFSGIEIARILKVKPYIVYPVLRRIKWLNPPSTNPVLQEMLISQLLEVTP